MSSTLPRQAVTNEWKIYGKKPDRHEKNFSASGAVLILMGLAAVVQLLANKGEPSATRATQAVAYLVVGAVGLPIGAYVVRALAVALSR